MNRIAFHIFAAVLLIVVVAFLGVRVRRPASAPDPQAQLIALMKSSGLDYLGARKMVSNETILSFGGSRCVVPVEVLYLPAINHISDHAFAHVAGAGGKPVFVHDGEAVAGLETKFLLPRWIWRKLQVAAGIAPARSWQSIALAMLDSSQCVGTPVDWRALVADGPSLTQKN